MKKYRSKRKGRRSFDSSADGRYTTIVCNIMASEKTRTAKAAVRATNSGLSPTLPLTKWGSVGGTAREAMGRKHEKSKKVGEDS
jgi:hypothetical protein